jgi:CheY-like chemotaxis protein
MACILVIDDHEEIRRLVRRSLEPAGHQILEASDGEMGMSLLAKGPVDLVITDVFMPGQDGIVTVRRIRKEYPATKIIVMSGGAMGGSLDLLRDAAVLGQATELKKPFRPVELLETVRAAIGDRGSSEE